MTISVTNRSDAEFKGKSLFLDMFILSQGTNEVLQFSSFLSALLLFSFILSPVASNNVNR